MRPEPSSFEEKGLVETGDWCLFFYGEIRSDLGAVYQDVLYRVCVIGREGEVRPGVFSVEAFNRIGDRHHQDVHGESSFKPCVCCFGAESNDLVLKHDQDEYLEVCIYTSIEYPR